MEREDREDWIEAISAELESLHKADTWEMMDRPRDTKVLPSQFVLKVKRDAHGRVDKYKARSVALGNLQRPNLDYIETYAPVVDFTVVRIVIVVALTQNMVIRQLDVKSAFLNGALHETIYMSLPKGFHADETKVCRLKKSLYGLKQAPKAWNTTLTKDLATLDFNPIDTAGSVFVRSKNTCLSYIIVYVDDMLIVTHEEREATQIVKDTGKIYEIKDLGTADYFLGIKCWDGGRQQGAFNVKVYILNSSS